MKTAMQEMIEYLENIYYVKEILDWEDIKKNIIQKEKEQIVKAWEDGDYAYFYSKETGRDFDNGEEYYKDVYSTKEVNDDKYSIFDCYGMIVEHYGINMTFEKAKNLIDKLNTIGDGFAPYTIEKNNQTYNQKEDKTFKQKSKWTSVDNTKQHIIDIMKADEDDELYNQN